MGEISDIQAALATKLIGADPTGVETFPLDVKSNQEAKMSDTCSTSAIDAVLALTTAAIEGKVGGSRLSNRKYVIMQALDNNVKWGFNTSCNFDLFKNQIVMENLGDVPIYFKMSSGTGSVVLAEKS